MITDTIERSKVIKDPLFTSIKKYLAERFAIIQSEGDPVAIKLAEDRYQNLKPEEVQIEPPTVFPNGSIRSCIAVRSRKFFHADAVIEQVTFADILSDFGIKPVEYLRDDLITAVVDKAVTFGFFYLTDSKEYVFVLNADKKGIDDIYKLLGELYWKKITVSLDATMNASTTRSGTVKIECWNINHPAMGIYYSPHVSAKKK